MGGLLLLHEKNPIHLFQLIVQQLIKCFIFVSYGTALDFPALKPLHWCKVSRMAVTKSWIFLRNNVCLKQENIYPTLEPSWWNTTHFDCWPKTLFTFWLLRIFWPSSVGGLINYPPWYWVFGAGFTGWKDLAHTVPSAACKTGFLNCFNQSFSDWKCA